MTLNACVHLPGARNVYNIALVSRSIFFLLLLTSSSLILWSCSASPLSTPIVVSLALLSIPFAVVVGQPLAMLMSFFIYAIKKDNFSEFKSERMDELFNSNAMHNHDVMCAQELYGSRFWGSSYYPTYMKRRAQEAGLCHSAFGGGPQWWMLFDSGLAIFSKHPISRSYHLIFKKQSIWDYLFVSRAALYAQIDLGKGKNLHVFTLHTAPSLDDMKKRTQLASLLEEKVPTVRQQGDELGEFMTKLLDSSNYNAKTDKIVCMGDFNVKAGTLDYFHFANIFSTKYQMVDITKKGGKDTDTWEPTFGLVDDDGFPLERLLTSPGLRGIPQTLDFIFTDAEKAGESSVLKLQCDDAKETRFQCVSDHAAVECKIKA